MQGCRKGRFMLDIKRVLKAAPTKMRSREPLQQLWTPWGERIDHEWLSARAGNKAFNPAEEGERTLDEAGADLYRLVLDVASGKQTCAEKKGFREISIFKDGVVL